MNEAINVLILDIFLFLMSEDTLFSRKEFFDY
jgi:hypothetical protein